MARRTFKQSIAVLGVTGLLASGGVVAVNMAAAPEAQAAGCYVVQTPKNLVGSCDTGALLSFKCVGIRGGWAIRYKKATNFIYKKPCTVAYNLKIKRSVWID